MKDMRDRRAYFRGKRSDPEFIAAEKRRAKLRQAAPGYAEAERLRSARRRAEAREHINAIARARHAERAATDPAYKAKKAEAAIRWVKNNPHKATANVVRRDAMKLKATPAWGQGYTLNEYYEVAAAMRNLGIDVEVDHIVPLRSDRVCGLHVSANLQILARAENRAKGNRSWPDG